MAKSENSSDLSSVFSQLPGKCLLVLPDSPDFSIVAATAEFAEMAHYGDRDVKGLPLTETFPKSKTTSPEGELERLLKSLKKVVAEKKEDVLPVQHYDVISESGIAEIRSWRTTNKPVFSGNGDVIYIIHQVEEITDELQFSRVSESHDQRIVSLIEGSPFPIAIYLGREMKIAFSNQAIRDVWGKGDDVSEQTYYSLLPELEVQNVYPTLDAVFTDGIPFHAKHQKIDLLVKGKMREFYFNYSFTPLRDSSGNVYGVINTASDVTDLVLALQVVEESKDQLHFAIEATELGTFDLNSKTGKFTSNSRLKSWFGLPETEEIDLQNAVDAIAEKDRQRVSGLINESLKPESGGRYETQYTIVNAQTGEERIVLAKGKTSFDESGVAFRLNGTLQDITSQAIAIAELAEKQQTLEMALDVAELGLFNYDLRSGMVINSPLVLDWFGLEEPVHSFSDLLQYILFDDRESVRLAFEQTASGINKGRHDVVYRVEHFKTGKLRYLRSIGQIIEEDGMVVAISGIKQDVTETVLAQQKIEEIVRSRTEELAETNRHLEKSNADLAQFAYIASHDLQEPLRKVSMFTQMLESSVENLPERAKNYLEKIKSSSLRMTALIRDVLTYSQLSGDEVSFTKVDLNEVLHATLTDFELLIEQTKAVIETENLPEVSAIPLQMSQLFNNLISNSLKYRRADVAPNIKIAVSEVERTIDGTAKKFHEIIFSDNGIGFSPEYAEQIFNIFQRLHRKSEYEGTGIGLSICRKIAENHNGELTAEGSSENGAVFHFRIPAE